MHQKLVRLIPFVLFIALALYTVSCPHGPRERVALLALGVGLAALTFWTMRPRA